jgi:hypothetical protein
LNAEDEKEMLLAIYELREKIDALAFFQKELHKAFYYYTAVERKDGRQRAKEIEDIYKTTFLNISREIRKVKKELDEKYDARG